MIAVITYIFAGEMTVINCEDRAKYDSVMTRLKHPSSSARDVHVYECVEMENPLGLDRPVLSVVP
jgi:hypothetical protein